MLCTQHSSISDIWNDTHPLCDCVWPIFILMKHWTHRMNETLHILCSQSAHWLFLWWWGHFQKSFEITRNMRCVLTFGLTESPHRFSPFINLSLLSLSLCVCARGVCLSKTFCLQFVCDWPSSSSCGTRKVKQMAKRVNIKCAYGSQQSFEYEKREEKSLRQTTDVPLPMSVITNVHTSNTQTHRHRDIATAAQSMVVSFSYSIVTSTHTTITSFRMRYAMPRVNVYRVMI